MYCTNCGKQIDDKAVICVHCGVPTNNKTNIVNSPSATQSPIGVKCPKCGQHLVQFQTVTESKKAGCFTVILYIILACTIFGLFIVIPLMLRKKTRTVTYAVCQNCGHKWKA